MVFGSLGFYIPPRTNELIGEYLTSLDSSRVTLTDHTHLTLTVFGEYDICQREIQVSVFCAFVVICFNAHCTCSPAVGDCDSNDQRQACEYANARTLGTLSGSCGLLLLFLGWSLSSLFPWPWSTLPWAEAVCSDQSS